MYCKHYVLFTLSLIEQGKLLSTFFFNVATRLIVGAFTNTYLTRKHWTIVCVEYFIIRGSNPRHVMQTANRLATLPTVPSKL